MFTIFHSLFLSCWAVSFCSFVASGSYFCFAQLKFKFDSKNRFIEWVLIDFVEIFIPFLGLGMGQNIDYA